MKRQCAWCLRLINGAGEHLSPSSLPKLYDATHGMCNACGARWIEQVVGLQDSTEIVIQMRTRMAETPSVALSELNTTVVR